MTHSSLPTFQEIKDAEERIRPHTHRTPVIQCSDLNALAGARLFFKCENFQKTGSFKARGATNAVFIVPESDVSRGIVTHSSGNHGQAIAYAASRRGVPAIVAMPGNSSAAKRSAVLSYGGRVVDCEASAVSRANAAKSILERSGGKFVHPYDDPHIIAGQATCALELLDQVPRLDAVIAPVGGGGLISGTCLSASHLAPETEVFGAEPRNADDARKSLDAGIRIIGPPPDTIADGLRTPLGKLNWECISSSATAILTASEECIVEAMRLIWQRVKVIVEPSSAVVLAAMLEAPGKFSGKRVGVILSGGNVDLDCLPWMAGR